MNLEAKRLNKQGQQLLDRRNWDAAISLFHQAVQLNPDWAMTWFNLGLAYKRKRFWRESMQCNLRAVELNPQEMEGWWNLGIAATALEDWGMARHAWNSFGVDIPPGDGQPLVELGLTPIRINPETNPELVWCKRIDPARALIYNVPLPASNRRYLDLILHDGEPVGIKRLHNQEVSIFEEISIIKPSSYSTYEIIINTPFREDIAILYDLAHNVEIGIDDWSALRQLCRACIEGKPHDRHDAQTPLHGPLYRLGIAAPSEQNLNKLLAVWQDNRPECYILRSSCVLPVTTE